MNYQFSSDGKLDREAAADALRRFVDHAIAGIGLDLRYKIETAELGADPVEPVEIRICFSGPDEGFVLERNGELLQALEYLAVRWLRLDPKLYDHVQLDAANYRSARVEELKLSARIAARRVIETGQAFRFNPMPARERRILHLAVADISGVQSGSEGVGDSRQVVITRTPKSPARPTKP